VSRVAQDLRKKAFAEPPGTFLGSEAELVEEFKVSRPTFRQAAKMLELEQLLLVKTGIGGGFYVRQPDIDAVAHMTSVYLHSRHTTRAQVLAIYVALYALVVRGAATRRGDEALMRDLNEFARQDRASLDQPLDWKTYIETQARLLRIFADLSGNPLMNLFFSIAQEMLINDPVENLRPPSPEHIAQFRLTRLKLVDVIRDGDPEVAELLARRYVAEATIWTMDDPGQPREPDLGPGYSLEESRHRRLSSCAQ
jgi:GntR family transcriptional repressor for pyruvate dehydrogenase complex